MLLVLITIEVFTCNLLSFFCEYFLEFYKVKAYKYMYFYICIYIYIYIYISCLYRCRVEVNIPNLFANSNFFNVQIINLNSK